MPRKTIKILLRVPCQLYIIKLRSNSRHPTVYPTSNLTFTLTITMHITNWPPHLLQPKMEKHIYIVPSNWRKISTFFSQNRETFLHFSPEMGKNFTFSPQIVFFYIFPNMGKIPTYFPSLLQISYLWSHPPLNVCIFSCPILPKISFFTTV